MNNPDCFSKNVYLCCTSCTFYMFMREYNFFLLTRKVVKATLLLLPLLGITYLLFLYSPTDDKAVVEAHKFINTFLQSFQVLILK